MSRRPRVKVAVNLTSKRSKKNDIKNSDDLENIKEESITFQEELKKPEEPSKAIVVVKNVEEKENAVVPSNPPPNPEPPAKPKPTIKIPVKSPPEEKSEKLDTAPVTVHSKHLFESPMKKIDQHRIPNKNLSFIQNARIRTESLSSNKSVISHYNIKKKGHYRTEETMRIIEAKKDFKKRFDPANPDKNNLTMYDMIYYNPTTNPIDYTRKSTKVKTENFGNPEDDCDNKDDKNDANLALVPQIKLGVNGEIILDETSLVVDNVKEKEALNSIKKFDVVYDDEISGNSGYYKRQKRTRDWPRHETIKFYRCLHTVGTDFSLMLSLFPNRTRRDLKLKFKKEEKNNLQLINKALMHPKEFNIDELSKEIEAEAEAEAVAVAELEPEPVIKKERTFRKRSTQSQDIKKEQPDNNPDDITENEEPLQPRKSTRRMRINSYDEEEVVVPPENNCVQNMAIQSKEEIIEIQLPSVNKIESLVIPETNDSQSIGKEDTNYVIDYIDHSGQSDMYDSLMDCEVATDRIENENIIDQETNGSIVPDSDDEVNTQESDDENDTPNSLDDIDISSLVLVESQDPRNPSVTIDEIYIMDPETKKLSAEPLDLPADVIQTIKLAISADT